MTETDRRPQEKRRRWPQVVVALIILILLLLLLLRGCKLVPPGKFDYFRAKARELASDPSKIHAFVEGLPTLAYTGDVKGPLGALWNGAGSADEKKLLEAELLAAIEKGPHATSSAPLKLTITHRAVPGDGAPRETPIVEAPIAAFLGDVHTIETPAAGKTRFTLRGRTPVTKEVSLGGAVSEEVVFSFQRPGQEQPIVVVRELWHAQNRVGSTCAVAGDRHDFVVLPTRITKYVREKEELILKEANRKDAPEAKPYLTLLDFAKRSDASLASLEQKMGLRAQYETPRILVLSKWPAPEIVPARCAQAIDLRWDRTSFEGDPVKAYQAQEARSFVEAGLEQQFLLERTGVPSTSTFDVFSKIKEDLVATPTRRLETIDRALSEITERGGADAQAVFTARDPRGAKRDKPVQATVTRAPGGAWLVKAGPVDAAFAKKLAEAQDAPKIPFGASGLDATFATREDAVVAVETALLGAATKPAVEPGYVLDTKLSRGHEPLVCKGAVFELSWGEGEDRTEQRIKVESVSDGLALRWKVQSSALPAAGKRRIAAAALDDATEHNAWYRAGTSEQKDATSFVVSRKVFAALKAGRASPFGLWAKLKENDDEKADRPLEWKGEVSPAGAGTVTVKVNGRDEKLALVKVKLQDREVALLDDATYPVGMADKLVSVSTSVRAKLVDERDLPIADAKVEIADTKVEPATSSVDGTFRLPPAPGGSYGKVKLRVTVGENPPEDVDVDLTAPGLAEVLVKAKRPRTELVYVTGNNANVLAELPLSDQVKRHAKADVEAGRMVVIPSRMVRDGSRQVIGYFACERDTGYLVGVTEDGLNGSNAWERAVASAAESAKAALKSGVSEEQGASAPLHAFRGAMISFWVYSSCRLEGMTHKEAIIATLEQMDTWAENTDIAHFANQALDDLAKNALEKKGTDYLAGKLTDLVGSGIVKTDDDAAKTAFKLGYIGGTLFLAQRLGDSDYDD